VNTLFIEYRDPLFGIIVFFALIFVIAFFSYWWGRFKTKEDHRYLDRFLRQFRTLPSEDELKQLISSKTISEKSWLLMAQAYFQNGDYEKSIEIYLALIEQQSDPQRQRELLFLLGQTYFKAGFLERSQGIFLQILKRFPRTPQALRYLLLIYEQLREYDKALEVLEPLDELGRDSALDRTYLECVALLQNSSVTHEEKAERLLEIYRQHRTFTYLIFEYLFRHHPQLAWKNLDQSQCERISDLLWSLPPDQHDLDIISHNSYLRELFSAKGSVSLAQSSSIFELDVLIKLQQCGHGGATLQFEYLCRECKQVFPFAFHRCPHCHAIDSVVTEALLTKDLFEENHSFQ
jgi:tetratricopeptide (TPR) repeat protein